MKDKETVSVLFICLGNICRSPTAHGVFRKLVKDAGLEDQIEIDSAGTANFHVGKKADARSRQVAFTKGIDMEDIRARQVNLGDMIEFDYILAMDESNYHQLMEIALPEHEEKVKMFLSFAKKYSEKEVPDPYYGGEDGFDHVFDLITDASEGLLSEIKSHLGVN